MRPDNPEVEERLKTAQNIWLASVRDGAFPTRPHLVPIWFVWVGEKLYISTEPGSVKDRNMRANPRVALALEDGLHPVICEGTARRLSPPWPGDVVAAFQEKYEWDVTREKQYNQVLEIEPQKWLYW